MRENPNIAAGVRENLNVAVEVRKDPKIAALRCERSKRSRPRCGVQENPKIAELLEDTKARRRDASELVAPHEPGHRSYVIRLSSLAARGLFEIDCQAIEGLAIQVCPMRTRS